MDCPHDIGHGVTISAPHMHATALDCLNPVIGPNARVLDVGSGSGYLSVCLARLAPNVKVIGVDVIPPIVDWSVENVKKNHADLLKSGLMVLKVADGWKGDESNAPFDAIHVGAAADGKVTTKTLFGVRYVPLVKIQEHERP